MLDPVQAGKPGQREADAGQAGNGSRLSGSRDWFLTDGTSSDGWIRCYGIGEYGEGWIYSGYVAIEEPKPVYEQYVCVAKTRVACRKWIDGPKVDGYAWLTNGSNVQVFYIAGDWAITSRGYIRSEWLEVDPR